MIKSLINSIQFYFRSKFLGKLRLRRGLPKADREIQNENEIHFYRKLLARVFEDGEVSHFNDVLDIGCRNWSYLNALAEFFPKSKLTGVEVDGLRRYWNLYRRIDQANAYCKALEKKGRSAAAIARDFRDFKVSFEFRNIAFCFFFPFVSENPCLQWGLPTEFADFSSLLRHSLLLTGSTPDRAKWISSHQGHWEAEIAKEVYHRLGFRVQEKVVLPSEVEGLWPSPYPTYLFSATWDLQNIRNSEHHGHVADESRPTQRSDQATNLELMLP